MAITALADKVAEVARCTDRAGRTNNFPVPPRTERQQHVRDTGGQHLDQAGKLAAPCSLSGPRIKLPGECLALFVRHGRLKQLDSDR